MALNDIWHFAPKTWNRSYEDDLIAVSRGSDEFRNVENDLKKGVRNLQSVLSISRCQNIYDFGQFLMRGQILATENPNNQYYEVRRYVAIPTALKKTAIKYNLDHRRLEMEELKFRAHLKHVKQGYSIFVVVILTENKKKRKISPYNFTEYYIDYVVDVDMDSTP